MHFTSNDGSQSTFVYQPTLDKLELKETKVLIMFLVGNQREYVILNLSHDILVFYTENFSCRTRQLLNQNCKWLRSV